MELSCAYCDRTLTVIQIPCEKCNLVYYCSTFHKSLDETRHREFCGTEQYSKIVPSSIYKSTFDNDESDSKVVINRNKSPYNVRSELLKPNKYVQMFRDILERNKVLLSNFTFYETPEELLEMGRFVGGLYNPVNNSLFTPLELFALSNEWKIYRMMNEGKEDDDWNEYLEKQKEFVKKNK